MIWKKLAICIVSIWIVCIGVASAPVVAQAGTAPTPWPVPGLVSTPLPSPECNTGGGRWYVDDVGTNGTGTLGSPFNNLQDGINAAQAGDTIYVLPGTYFLTDNLSTVNAGTSQNRICLRAYDLNDRPIVRRAAGYVLDMLRINQPYFVVDGLIFDGDLTPNTTGGLINIQHYARLEEGTNGDYAIMRNCIVRNNQAGGINVGADHVLIENCEIHHLLRKNSVGAMKDAHGITGSHQADLTVRHCDIHHTSGDGLQTDPDVTNRAGTKHWDQVLIEHTRIWTGPLEEDAGVYAAGELPGENAVDTKTFEPASVVPFRPQITIRNVEVFGYQRNPLMNNPAAFNIKYEVDWLIDGVTAYDNQYVFRTRGPWENPAQGGAHLTLMNAVAYGNEEVFRIERLIENLHIYNSTFANNTAFSVHLDCPDGDPRTCYDPATFELRNGLFLGTKPREAFDTSNLEATDADFQSIPGYDFQLRSGSVAIDAGLPLAEVFHDRNGSARPQGDAWDVGAYELLPRLNLHGSANDRTVYLHWEVNTSLPVTTTWHIAYDTDPASSLLTVTIPSSATREYVLTNLTNYSWYSITLTAVGPTPPLSDTIRIMPTDQLVYLPLVFRDCISD